MGPVGETYGEPRRRFEHGQQALTLMSAATMQIRHWTDRWSSTLCWFCMPLWMPIFSHLARLTLLWSSISRCFVSLIFMLVAVAAVLHGYVWECTVIVVAA